ncbi:hypothetical protein EDB86DRAFT_2879765 [Lactarius hatsudake]|nr:hypothetical protein EDB86DRAFT_2879765 [Lactarius hatsudake]
MDGIGLDPGLLPGLQELISDFEGVDEANIFDSFIRARRVAGRPIDISFLSPWDALKEDVEAEFNLSLVDDVKEVRSAALASATTPEEKVAIQREFDESMADIRALARAELQRRVEAERERRLLGNFHGKDALVAEQHTVMDNILHENMRRDVSQSVSSSSKASSVSSTHDKNAGMDWRYQEHRAAMQKREQEVQRKEAAARRYAEEARRREEAAARHEEKARRKNEEATRRLREAELREQQVRAWEARTRKEIAQQEAEAARTRTRAQSTASTAVPRMTRVFSEEWQQQQQQ